MVKKRKRFVHLDKNDRNEIGVLLDKNYSLRSIAKVLNRSVSTISDEIKYNNVNGVYNPQKAQHKATVRRQKSSFQGKK